MKKIVSIFLLAIAFLLIDIPAGNSKIKSYYSGDAVYYQDKIIIGSANTGSLELFKVENGTMIRTVQFKPSDNNGQLLDVSSVKLNEEDGRLYAYLTAQYAVYKYDISDPAYPSLENKIKNTIWEWYNRVDTAGDKVMPISAKNVGVLNFGLQNINNYNLENINSYNVRPEDSGRYIFNNSGNYVQVYDRYTRTTLASIPVNYKKGNEENNHKVVGDVFKNEILVVDDYYAKKFDFNGNLKASFKHLDQPGYDMELSPNGHFVYFSNGVGVVKLNRSDLKLNAYKFTSVLGGPAGWAMGLKAVNTKNGENLVVFNNGNILVLDDKLNKIASYVATIEDNLPDIQESLYLNLDHNLGAAGAPIVLSGGGFSTKEMLTIEFGSAPRLETMTDSHGRFIKNLTIPNLTPGRLDIKVTGQSSRLSYSISFEVK